MYKKALLASAVASALLLSTGCEVSSVEDNDTVDTNSISEVAAPEKTNFRVGTHPILTLVSGDIQAPLTNDLLFAAAAQTDGTASTADTTPPVTTAINDLDGFSLTAAIDIPFSGPLNPDSVIPGSVLLVEMANSAKVDALDIKSILAANPSNPFASPGIRPVADYSVSVIAQGETPVVRILPVTPLKPATKYLVIVSDQIKDIDNKAIVPSDDFQLLNQLTSAPEGSFGAVTNAIKGWTKLAAGVLGNNSEGQLGESNVALALTFTTGGADSILKAMAAPILHLKSPQLVGGAIQFGALNPPKSRPFTLIKSTETTPVSFTPNSLGISADPFTRYVQGGLTIPQGISAPVLTDVQAVASGNTAALTQSMASDSIWRANTALGGIIDNGLKKPAGTTPPKDSDGTYNVTYRYPHASLNEMLNVPLLITVPGNYSPIGGKDCTKEENKPWKVAIFIHGITSDRTASVGVGNALANKACIATVAMDLPMHGVAPLKGNAKQGFTINSLRRFNAEQNSDDYPFGKAANSATPAIKINERHYNVGSNPLVPGSRAPMDFEGSEVAELSGTSGSHFINLFNFQRTRDNMRQASLDMMNLAASIGDMDVTGDGVADLDKDNIHFLGHSLGGILGLPFVAVINDPAVQAANPSLPKIKSFISGSPGSQMTKLLENSPAFAPTIIGTLAKGGIPQGSDSFEKYLQALQATIASADPVNFAKQLGESDTPILLYNMIGGGDIGADTALLPAGFAQAFGGKYPPDHVVPNYDYFKDENNPYKNIAPVLGLPISQPSAKSSLAGTNALIRLMSLQEMNSSSSTVKSSTPIKAAVNLQKGTHATFAGADAKNTFNEIATQIISFILSDGKQLPVDNTNNIYAPAANQ